MLKDQRKLEKIYTNLLFEKYYNNLKFLFENDVSHSEALRATGFWGKQGAGSLVFCSTTKRFLLPHRSRSVEQPNTWGVWGGAIDSDEDPEVAAKRELEEEAGYSGHIDMVPLSVFSKGTFKYFNFLAIVDHEFEPELNWETQAYVWTTIDDLPHPLHFGLSWLLSQDYSKLLEYVK